MEIYAREGLRTLLVASADLEADWFAEWDKRCVSVSVSCAAPAALFTDGEPLAFFFLSSAFYIPLHTRPPFGTRSLADPTLVVTPTL